ncbi:MAG: hypothetical protein ACR2KV_00060 [Solirubrobacteraceae bacterium]
MGITIPDEQAALGRERVAAFGPSDQIVQPIGTESSAVATALRGGSSRIVEQLDLTDTVRRLGASDDAAIVHPAHADSPAWRLPSSDARVILMV